MCGIVAIFAYREGPPVDAGRLRRTRDFMAARGPDGSGEWFNGDRTVGMGHRRLAVIDLSTAGAQPMANADGSLVIVFNGEIYNHRELRAELLAQGRVFRSTSDTEVLLALYERKSAAMVHDLRGMYAFAIWDARQRRLVLGRDPFGIKPLYYADDGRTIRVASQVKALLAGGDVDTSAEPAGHAGFFLWGHVPEPYTLYRGIRAVPAGACLIVEGGCGRSVSSVRSVSELIATAGRAAPSASSHRGEALATALRDAVRSHLVADVPVGIFLSAGLDSTTLAAVAADLGFRLNSVTLGFEEYRGTDNDETPLAEAVARQLGFAHETVWVGRREFEEERERLFEAMDQPSNDGVNSYFVSKAAAAVGIKVALSGLGGDELFGGYPSFRQLPRSVAALCRFGKAPAIGRALRMITAPAISRLTSPKYASVAEYGGTWAGAYLLRRSLYLPWELPRVIDADVAEAGLRELRTLERLAATESPVSDDHGKVMALESCWYLRNQLLRDTDWASMAHSVEVRVPFVDVHLARTVRALGAAGPPVGKREVSRIAGPCLPEALIGRRKTGFLLPVREWSGRSAGGRPERRLRGWVRQVYRAATAARPISGRSLPAGRTGRGLKVAALLTDGFGARGGIAQFNRNFVDVLCEHRAVDSVIAYPRHAPDRLEATPDNLAYRLDGLGGKHRYLQSLIRHRRELLTCDIIVCGHVNLMPAAWIIKKISGARIILVIHGVDAWQAVGRRSARRALGALDAFISVSELTTKRFLSWAPVRRDQGFLLPNCVDTDRFKEGPRRVDLLRRYGLEGKKVLLTVGRIVSEERGKGFDEVLGAMPLLLAEEPDLVYLVIGEGDGLFRLREKARELRIAGKVVFAGYVDEKEKPDHYRLADVYVMPSRGEGFGIVFLEAMACGIPVVASKIDGSREAVRGGELGLLVDPDSPEEIAAAIRKALAMPRGVPDGLRYFSAAAFSERLKAILDKVLDGSKERAA